MGFYDAIRVGASGAVDSAYTVDRSLRFNVGDNTYLSRTPSSAGNRRTWTISFWFKTEGGGSLQGQRFWSVHNATVDGLYATFAYENDGFIASLRSHLDLRTTAVFRDPTAWYHVVLAVDTTQSTSSDRAKLYVNNTQITDFNTASYPSQNHEGGWNSTATHNIGRELYQTRRYFGGYMTEFINIDGQQYDPSYFGETDAITGQWNPKKYVGSYGTNGFYLNFSDNSGTTATTLGKDSSGNGNNFTPNNFATGDAVKDTPTNNFCTFNPIKGYTNGVTFSEGNLRCTHGAGGNGGAPVNFGLQSGKWYVEMLIEYNGNGTQVGISGEDSAINSFPITDCLMIGASGEVITNGSNSSPSLPVGNTFTDGDIMGMALDITGGTIKWYKNNSLVYTLNLSTMTSGGNSDSVYFFTSGDGSSVTAGRHVFNAGQDSTFRGNKTKQGNADGNGIGDFYYSPPSGHLAVCSANLPDPTILLPNKHFDTVLYTGDGSSSRAITGTGHSPDFVWLKKRNGTGAHFLYDTVRGATKGIHSNLTDAETTYSDGLLSFDSDGFTVGDRSNHNGSSGTFVAWNWNAGGSTVTNDDGSIDSQVRANTTAGFSIVTYTGTGSNATVGHGLGVKPDSVIVKRRTGGTSDWFVFHKDIGNTKNLRLNLSNSQFTTANIWDNTDPTSSVVNIGFSSGVNGNGSTYVMYCFSEVAGYSKFGSYTGNGSTDGTFVFTGFRPAFILAKSTYNTEDWYIYDNKREGFNPTQKLLYANLSLAEGSGSNNKIDFLSNGFKFRSTGAPHYGTNSAGYIYLAFAESPFKYARAR